MYFTDRGIEELETRRGEESVTLAWVADQLRTFVDLNPEFEVPLERLATWLARLDDEADDD
ncbi:MAG TPA: DUF6104 family protein [Acidothermaceae bacterium]|nr:DUF6104 family protein [Acidothermaceae bacterium]